VRLLARDPGRVERVWDRGREASRRATVPVHHASEACDGDAIRVRFEIGQLLFEPVRVSNVIGVMAGDEFRHTVRKPRIQLVDDAAMRPREDDDARVGSRHARQDGSELMNRTPRGCESKSGGFARCFGGWRS